jgi:putative tryptophan/tyrosine transport system substrate-binding protein
MGRTARPLSRRHLLRGSLALAGLGLLAGCGLAPPLAKPPAKIPRIGYLCPPCPSSFTGPPPPGSLNAQFVEELRDLGHVDGETVAIEWRGADGMNERLPGLAAELVGHQVDVIVTGGATPVAIAAKQATDTIPIVCIAVGDPVGNGLIASFARPGGNLTGTTNFAPETGAKRLQLLKEVVPGATRVDVVWNFANPAAAPEWEETQAAARQLGMTLQQRDVRDPAQIEGAFQAMAVVRPDALLVSGEPFFIADRERLVELAAAMGLPAMYFGPEFVAAGGLMSYGSNSPDLFRRAAYYVDKILKGARPADLPVERPTRFDFAINLQAARALGLTMPESVLQQATEIIQ